MLLLLFMQANGATVVLWGGLFCEQVYIFRKKMLLAKGEINYRRMIGRKLEWTEYRVGWKVCSRVAKKVHPLWVETRHGQDRSLNLLDWILFFNTIKEIEKMFKKQESTRSGWFWNQEQRSWNLPGLGWNNACTHRLTCETKFPNLLSLLCKQQEDCWWETSLLTAPLLTKHCRGASRS